MPRITKDLLRSRTEHNEGCLATLEEITLHQFELEKIELLDTYCRHLKILYLQNNIIEKMEGLSKLKELEYLNLALNNISRIENIEGCESLRKLDLTVNFIDIFEIEDSMVSLSRCPLIKELYLTGNPCTDWSGYRDFVLALVPSLDSLDGKDITPTDRIRASQKYDDLLVDLNHKIEMKKIEKAQEEENKRLKKLEDEKNGVEIKSEVPPEEQKSAYTKETRREMYLEMAADKEKKEREKNPDKFKEPKKETAMYRSDGEIRQCNEGKYKFTLREWDDPDWTIFEIEVPKYLDTSFLDVNIDPKWVSVRVKGKLTQLRLQEEISVGQSETKRSQMTGILTIKMKKIVANEYVRSIQKQEHEEKLKKDKEKISAKEKEEAERREKLKLCDKIETKFLLKSEDHSTFDDVPDLE